MAFSQKILTVGAQPVKQAIVAAVIPCISGLCLFLGLAALFLIAAASAKMLLYISGYGLTRKRVLTEVFMLWLGGTTILVSVWLFKPRFPYMKGAVICALILGCVTFWGDVDTFVARYNVRAYQSGRLETIDMGHMGSLGDGGLPYIKELTHDRDPEIASTAMDILENSYCSISDFRSWTYTESAARKAVETLHHRQPKIRRPHV